MIADLYICWAYYFEILENFDRAEKVYRMGFDARAQPMEELQQAHNQFLLSVGQRTLYRDEKMRQTFFSTMEERRSALTSLRGHHSHRIGSIRTGGVVRDLNPGRVEQGDAARSTHHVASTGIPIFVDGAPEESINGPHVAGSSSGIQSIVSSATKQENQWEPGPWSKAKKRTQSTALFPSTSRSTQKLEFEIMEDSEEWDGNVRLPVNFVRRNNPQPEWNVIVALHEDLPGGFIPQYDKILCYPKGQNVVLSPEELRAYNWFKRRGKRVRVTEELEEFVENYAGKGIRLPDNFQARNEKQDAFAVDKCKLDLLSNQKLMCCIEAMNLLNDKEEMSFEELRRGKRSQQVAKQPVNSNEFCVPQPPPPPQVINMNETCSTQTFNFFIKPHSISTPKQDLKKPIATPRSSMPLGQLQPPEASEVKQEVPQAEGDDSPGTGTKQLSTIWEVTEPSTTQSSSSTNTKSSTSSADSPDNVPPLMGQKGILRKSQGVAHIVTPPTNQDHNHGQLGNNSIKSFRDDVHSFGNYAIYEDPTESFIAPPKKQLPTDDAYYSEFLESPASKKKKFENKVSPLRPNDSFTFPSMQELPVPSVTSTIFARHEASGAESSKCAGAGANREIRLVSGNGSGLHGHTFGELPKLTHSQNGQPMRKVAPMNSFRAQKTTTSEVVEDDDDDDVVIVPMNSYNNATTYSSPRSSNFSPSVPKVPKITNAREQQQQQHVKHNLSIIKEVSTPMANTSFTFPPNNLNDASVRTFARVDGVRREATNADLDGSHTVPYVENVWAKEWSLRKDGEERKSHIVSHVSENDPLRMTISMRDGNRTSPGNNSLYVTQSPQPNRSVVKVPRQEFPSPSSNGSDSGGGQSIYVMGNNSVNGTITLEEDWSEDDNQPLCSYQRKEVDMNETQQVIDHNFGLEMMNPFNPKLINAFLEKADFMNFLESLETCTLTNIVKMIKPNTELEMNGRIFDVGKLLGAGTFGKVYHAKCRTTGESYALKQERPANLWEYYIVLELKFRLNEINPSLMSAFVDVELAMIGNNASILALPFCRYGTLLNVCNVHKSSTEKNLHELIVIMLATQILSIIDHLHACNIIHADIKPDNFMLTSKLNYDSHYSALKLIDFGQSIDMKLFPEKTTFKYVVKTEGFTCTEMLDNKPWTYQTDLFGIAATIHVLLFGKYMNVTKNFTGWVMTTKLPRYFQKVMWERIFSQLLNIRDCQSMPNLQDMRSMLKEELAMKESLVRDQIIKFNSVLDNYKP
uniref:Uncharacterized protein n=2 Tax=Lutzomyia longipalpis TaxID=7200 RepID=A0A1B0GK82_LUTLO